MRCLSPGPPSALLTSVLSTRLVSASCNRAAIRIQWTKLKTVPIQLCLDEIRVMIETCDKLPGEPGASVQVPVMAQPQGYYGFTDKVVDGICLSVNLVHVTLNSLAFTASFQMSRIVVESKSPSWQKVSLPHTRLKDLDRGEVLIFKELSWQTVRIEARSTVATELTPLRLITNQARVRMTLKKRMSDCAILGVRLVTILDDLLWVLTDDQLKAALHFVGSVSGLVKKATEETQKAKAARKLDNSGISTRKAGQTTNRIFAKYDVTETSYHFYSDRIDLHFCDDPGGGRSQHPSLQGGGAFQVSLARLQADYYPYHLARGDRKHWVRYNTDSSHRAWLLSNLANFDTKLLDVVLSGQNKTPLSRAGRGQQVSGGQKETAGCDEAFRDLVVSQLSRLMTTNIVLRLGDLTLWRVSTSSSPSGRSSQPTEMLKGDCVRLHLPPDLPLLHLELSQFYYPGDMDFPLPPPCLLLTVNPITVMFDVLTLVWLNAFALNLEKCVSSLQESFQQEEGDGGGGYADVKVELVMPRIVASPGPPRTPHPWRPSSLQISASKISISNYRSLDTGSRADLANALDKFQQSPLFFGGSFPSHSSDPSVVTEKFWSHATGSDTVREPPPANISQAAIFRKDLLWSSARDVWCCSVGSVWAEFHLSPPSSRPVPLLDATPLSVWLYARPPDHRTLQADRPTRKLLTEFYGEKQEVGLQVLVTASQPVSLQLDHHQLLFLLRLVESLAEMGAFLSCDSNRISAPNLPPGMVVGGVLPQLDISLILAADRDSTVRVESPQEVSTSLPASLPTLLPTSVPVPEETKTLEPVLDLSDPLSVQLESCVVTPEPPVKLQLQTVQSNGLFTSSSLRSNTSSKSKTLTSSFNSKLDGLSSPSYLSLLGSGTRSPDLDTLSVRSDESGDSSWHDSEAGWTMVSDSLDVGEGLFKVDRTLESLDRWDSQLREVSCLIFPSCRGPSPAEVAEEVYEKEGEGLELCPEERIVSVLTLHLGRLAIAQISRHDGSSILLDTSSLLTTLSHDQDYHQFQFR